MTCVGDGHGAVCETLDEWRWTAVVIEEVRVRAEDRVAIRIRLLLTPAASLDFVSMALSFEAPAEARTVRADEAASVPAGLNKAGSDAVEAVARVMFEVE